MRIIRSQMMRYAGHVATNNCSGTSKGRRPHERPSCKGTIIFQLTLNKWIFRKVDRLNLLQEEIWWKIILKKSTKFGINKRLRI